MRVRTRHLTPDAHRLAPPLTTPRLSVAAEFSYFRNQDAPGKATDKVLINRSLPKSCVGAR